MAVATGAAFAALGTDTAGSIRLPAAFCGVSGLKARHGALPMEGILPLAPSMDSAGAFARSAEDLALVWTVLSGDAAPAGDLDGLRIGVPDPPPEADDEIAAAVAEAVERAGRRGVPVTVPPWTAWERPRGRTLVAEALDAHRAAGWYPARRERYGAEPLAYLESAERLTDADRSAARQELADLAWRLQAALGAVDVLALPVCPVAAPARDADPQRAARELTPLCGPANAAGLAAASVPCGFTSGGLPIGLQLVGEREERRAGGRPPLPVATRRRRRPTRGSAAMKPAELRVPPRRHRRGRARAARRAGRGRQAARRRPEPRADDELPDRPAAGARRHLPHPRPALHRPRRRRPAHRRAHRPPRDRARRRRAARRLRRAQGGRAARRPHADPLARHVRRLGRARGPLGGVVHAHLLLDGEIVARSAEGERTIAAADLFLGFFTTTLEPGEILAEVRFQRPLRQAAIEEFARRHGDFAIVAVAAGVESDNGSCSHARVVDRRRGRGPAARRGRGGDPARQRPRRAGDRGGGAGRRARGRARVGRPRQRRATASG